MSDSIVGSLYEVYNAVSTEVGIRGSKKQENLDCPPGKNSGSNGKVNGVKKESSDPVIFELVKEGNLNAIRDIFQSEGVSCLNCRDRAGHTPMHWAALNGHTSIVQFIMDSGGSFNDPSDHDLGQYPIHWACVNNSVPAVDLFLQAGVFIDVVDKKGCTPLIIASQYGRTVMVAYLLGKGADLSIADLEGDTAIHWAAFKGCSDVARLLIYSGADPHARDSFGQTPLHLGAISGDLNLVRDLCRVDKVEINVVDRNGKTPLMLAAGRERIRVEMLLKNEIKERARILPKIDFRTILFGPPGNSKGPILFFIISIGFWGYPMYIFRCVPVTYDLMPWLHYIFIFMNVLMWVALYHANSTDPGFLPRNITEYDTAIKQAGIVDSYVPFSELGVTKMSQLCHTCRTVKPIRSKHCRICNRCVLEMDHHCPYIYNCVGARNRAWFVAFVNIAFILAIISVVFAYYTIQHGYDAFLIASSGVLLFGTLIVTVTWYCVWSHALRNITTNESMNKYRYKYLKDSDGKFRNPFDKGWRLNLMEYFYLRRSDPLCELRGVQVM